MAYTRIPLSFETISKSYRDYKSLPTDINTWITNQNNYEDAENDKRQKHNSELGPGEKPLSMLGHSTTCCMQASLSFNATGQPIPKTGSRDRNNQTLDGGKHYILSVDEFRAYLTYKYGPTDQVADLASIKGKTGVLIFGSAHIEFWDGDNIFQSPEGAKKRAANKYVVNNAAVMAGGILNAKPRYFWEIAEDASPTSATVPEWAQGWWEVYDGNYYYYYFSHDAVSYIKTKPIAKWIPPKTIGNQGTVTLIPNGLSILWKPTEPGGVGTKEDFTRRDWTSTTEMNGMSNKYSPLYARKM